MKITWLRIDDRFIHGQITAAWLNHTSSNTVWVVNDTVAQKPVLKQLQLTLAPPGVKVEVLTIREAIEKINRNEGCSDRVLILVASPRDALELVRGGAKIDLINVGQMGWKTGKVKVEKTVNVSKEDIEAFIELNRLGIKLMYQQLPDFPPKPIDLMQRLKEAKLV